jgi:hypothetical protein
MNNRNYNIGIILAGSLVTGFCQDFQLHSVHSPGFSQTANWISTPSISTTDYGTMVLDSMGIPYNSCDPKSVPATLSVTATCSDHWTIGGDAKLEAKTTLKAGVIAGAEIAGSVGANGEIGNEIVYALTASIGPFDLKSHNEALLQLKSRCKSASGTIQSADYRWSCTGANSIPNHVDVPVTFVNLKTSDGSAGGYGKRKTAPFSISPILPKCTKCTQS